MDEKQEKQVEACRKLGMTDEEIKEMLDDDKAIDRSIAQGVFSFYRHTAG